MKRVVIESPYAGDVEKNKAYARACVLDCLSRGEAPIASHLLLTQVLDDADPEQRAAGIAAGVAWHVVADLVAFYVDHGWSPGMIAARVAIESLAVVDYQIRMLPHRGARL
tara:strand:- start:88 stop:420 length:333 start_codon:yes stop_codon:yes gene_type:complete